MNGVFYATGTVRNKLVGHLGDLDLMELRFWVRGSGESGSVGLGNGAVM